MKKTTLILVLIALCLLLSSCISTGGIGLSFGRYTYEDASRYTPGAAKIRDNVKALDINWIAGDVQIEYHGGSEVILSETSARSLKAGEDLHWYLDGSTLRVKYAASGFRSGAMNYGKSLTVQLPKGMQLEDVKINAVSAAVKVADLTAEKISIDTVSGKVSADGCEAESMAVNTVSGAVEVYARQMKKLTVNTVSGSQTLEAAVVPERINAESVSGKVTICLPEGAGFTANADSVSGSVNGSLPMERKGKRYTSGNGACSIDVETVSGSIRFDVTDR